MWFAVSEPRERGNDEAARALGCVATDRFGTAAMLKRARPRCRSDGRT